MVGEACPLAAVTSNFQGNIFVSVHVLICLLVF